MLTAKRLSVVCAASILALAGAAAQPSPQIPSPGQPPVGAPRPPVKRAPAAEVGAAGEPAAASIPKFDLEFEGGPVESYAAMLRRVAGPAANIVVSTEAESLPLGRVSLKSVTVADAVQVIETARRIDGYVQSTARVEQRGGVFLINVSRGSTGTMGGPPTSSGSGVTVFNITGAGGPTTPPEVTLSAVEAAVRLIETPGDKTQISYHKESGLLFVVGGPLAQDSVRNVIQSIGASRSAQQQKGELEAVRTIVSVLGVADAASAVERVRELLGAKKAAEDMRVEAVAAQAGREAMMNAMSREMDDLRKRMADQALAARKAEEDARLRMDEARTKLLDANRALLTELDELRSKLHAAENKK